MGKGFVAESDSYFKKAAMLRAETRISHTAGKMSHKIG
jgi:hypothetical protein